jgi:putative tricarboxylic transport membrane protein
MWDFDAIVSGAQILFTWKNLLWLLIGFTSGIIVGAIPGLVEATFLAVTLPFTIYLDIWSAVFFITGAYVAAEAAGSYPAILVNMPGTPGTTATTFEGYPLTKKGLAGQAIGVSVTCSAVGALSGALMFMFFGPLFAALAFNFGSPETFMLAVFGMTAVASLTGESVVKGLISAALGLLIATTGLDLYNALPRATFGINVLEGRMPILPVLLGLFGFAEILVLCKQKSIVTNPSASFKGIKALWEGAGIALRYPWVMVRSAIIGMIVGIVPGAGSATANVVSYAQAKMWSREPEKFGSGTYEGLVATDVSNNSVVPGALIPTLTLGIPGSSTAVILMAALMMQGINPGARFYVDYAAEAYAMGWGMVLCAVFILVICLPLAATFARVAFMPTRVLVPLITFACIFGVFTTRQFLEDIAIMIFFGVFGFLLRVYGYSLVALLLGVILGPLMEDMFFLSLRVAGPFIFFTKPIALTLFVLSMLSLMLPFFLRWMARVR